MANEKDTASERLFRLECLDMAMRHYPGILLERQMGIAEQAFLFAKNGTAKPRQSPKKRLPAKPRKPKLNKPKPRQPRKPKPKSSKPKAQKTITKKSSTNKKLSSKRPLERKVRK